MPSILCPECGQTGHLNVVDIHNWYSERWPDYKVGDVVPELCFKCWSAIKEYDSVIIHDYQDNNNNIRNGDIGVVVHICGGDEYELEGVDHDGKCKWHEILNKKYLNKINPKMRLTNR